MYVVSDSVCCDFSVSRRTKNRFQLNGNIRRCELWKRGCIAALDSPYMAARPNPSDLYDSELIAWDNKLLAWAGIKLLSTIRKTFAELCHCVTLAIFACNFLLTQLLMRSRKWNHWNFVKVTINFVRSNKRSRGKQFQPSQKFRKVTLSKLFSDSSEPEVIVSWNHQSSQRRFCDKKATSKRTSKLSV